MSSNQVTTPPLQDEVINYSSRHTRTWGSITDTFGVSMYLFGKIRCEPKNETITQMVEKASLYFNGKLHVKTYCDSVEITTDKLVENVVFVKSNKNPAMAQKIVGQHKDNFNKVFGGWVSVEYQTPAPPEVEETAAERETRFDAAGQENTQALIPKSLLLDWDDK